MASSRPGPDPARFHRCHRPEAGFRDIGGLSLTRTRTISYFAKYADAEVTATELESGVSRAAPTRRGRDILRMLRDGPPSSGDIAARFSSELADHLQASGGAPRRRASW